MNDSSLCYDETIIFHYVIPYDNDSSLYSTDSSTFSYSEDHCYDYVKRIKSSKYLSDIHGHECFRPVGTYTKGFRIKSSHLLTILSGALASSENTQSNRYTHILSVPSDAACYEDTKQVCAPISEYESSELTKSHADGEKTLAESITTSSSLYYDGDNIEKLPIGICYKGDFDKKGFACRIAIPCNQNQEKASQALALLILDCLKKNVKEKTELYWIRHVQETKDDGLITLDMDDQADLLHIRFNEVKDKRTFENYAKNTVAAVVLNDQYLFTKYPSVTYSANSSTNSINITEKGSTVETSLPEDTESRIVCNALDSLKANPIKKVPSISIDFTKHINGLIRYLQNVTPEGYYIANNTKFAIVPFGNSASDHKQLIGVRLLIVEGAGVALRILKSHKEKIPSHITNMFSYSEAHRLLDLSAILRCVPIDSQSFMVTLKNDEATRIVLTKFQSVLHRWAIGDILDSISCYGAMCKYECSSTTYHVYTLHLIQRYKKLLSDSVEKEPLICLDEESEDVEKKSFSVVLDKNKLSLKLQNDNVKLLDPVVTSIESVKRLNESIVSVGLESPLEPLILHFSKPKMQCYFAEYIKTQIRRNAFFQPIPVSSEVEQSMGDASALLSHLLQVCREHCFMLARLSVQVQQPDGDTIVPCHFNLLCTRIVPNSGILASFQSIDLRYIEKQKTIFNNKILISVRSFANKGDLMEDYILYFSSLIEIFAFDRFCHHLSLYYNKEPHIESRSHEGKRVLKPGFRVLQAKNK